MATCATSAASKAGSTPAARSRRPDLLRARRHDLHHKPGRRLGRTERPRHLVLDRRNAAQERDHGLGVLRREVGKGMPRHDRRQHAAVRPGALLESGDDLGVGPGAKPGLLVGCQVGAMKDAEARNLEADVGAAEKARHVGLAEEVARRVAVVAAGDVHQILAPLDRRIGGECPRRRRTRQDERRGRGAPRIAVDQFSSRSTRPQFPDGNPRVNR